MGKFELKRLSNYDDESLIAEIRRVSDLVSGSRLTVGEFDKYSKVESTTIRNRFGGWRPALAAAGLENRFHNTNARRTTREVVAELKRVAQLVGTATLGRRQFDQHGSFTQKAVTTAYGSWAAALDAAGLKPNYIRDPSNEQCFKNLFVVWTYYGRQPNFGEMKLPPSQITGKVYARKWRTWRNALEAFVKYAEDNSDQVPSESPPKPSSIDGRSESLPVRRTPRDVNPRLRWRVLERDNFTCRACGRSPALFPGLPLEADHIVAWALGGETVIDNLQALCQTCNVGKGTLPANGKAG